MRVLIFHLLIFATNLLAEEACTNFPIGNERVIKHSDWVTSASFSPDSKNLVTTSRDRTAKVINLATGNEMIIQHSETVNSASFSPDGKSVVTASLDGTAKVVDLVTGKEKVIQHDMEVNSASFSPDSKNIVTASSDGTVKVVDLATGKEIVIQHYRSVNSATFSPDSKSVVTASATRTAKVIDIATRKERVVHHYKEVNAASFSPDGKSVVTASVDGTAKVVDLATGNERVIRLSNWRIVSASFSPDSKSVVTASDEGTAKVVDLATGKEIVIQHSRGINAASFSPDGKSIVTASGDRTAKVVDLATGKERVIKQSLWMTSASFSPDSMSVVTTSRDGTAKVVELKSACISNQREMVPTTPTLCQGSCENGTGQLKINLQTKLLCQTDYNTNAWSSLTSDLTATLLRLQKPDGFNIEKDLPTLLAVLESDYVKSYPSLIQGALMGVLSKSNELYKELLLRYPNLKKLGSTNGDSLFCLTEKEKKDQLKTVEKYLNYLIDTHPTKTKWEDWGALIPLTPFLSQLDQESVNRDGGYLDRIAQSLADGVVDTREYSGLFLSKVYKFTANRVAPLFGEKSKELTDITLVRDKEGVIPIILSSSSLGKDSDSRFGFSLETKKKFEPTWWRSSQQLNWTSNSKSYQSTIKIIKGESRNLVPKSDSFDYESLWKDKKLTGTIMTGTNLGSAQSVMDEYLSYYEDLDYEFDEPVEIADLAKWLESEVKSGKSDYLIKEAHSDGDEKNLFRMAQRSRLMIGRKELPDGREEIVNLVFPSPSNKGSKLLSNGDFGTWIKEREKSGAGDLIYFNTSCWSKNKAIHEIEAAQSTRLVNIPSLTTMYTFSTQKNNAEKLMLTAFLEGKNFDGIRESMSKNEGYKNRQSDVMLFPDEHDYDSHIRQVVATPLTIDLKITEDGKPYSFEEAARNQ